MPRRAPAARREVQPDSVYNNRLVTQLINKVLWDGKKSVAERAVYSAFDIIESKTASDPLATFKKAMDNVRPALEVRPKRVGGATYQVPIEVNSRRATTLAISAQTPREDHGRASGERDHGRRQQHGRVGEAPRGPLQDGRVEPGLLALPLVSTSPVTTSKD